MTHAAITIEGLGKAYRLGQKAERYPTLREALYRIARAPLERLRELRGEMNGGDEVFWALRDVSFEVPRGEVIGVIGRNGAGKSTLLKLLSRITEPTEGLARLRGRVASLLEVGTGFHPELTGRENIYLNGAILGMRKIETDRKFDEIVAFAEIEKFLDTPVKRYSSGMYVRLAFAVAAHLEPEILIVDEVLAVGDAEFQKKCMGKMQEVATGRGRTVVFVSHNMPAVRSLCRHAVLLEKGRLAMQDTAAACVDHYLARTLDRPVQPTVQFAAPQDASLRLSAARLLVDGAPCGRLPFGSTLSIEVDFEASAPVLFPRLGFVIATAEGERLVNANNRYQPSPSLPTAVRKGTMRCDLGAVPLMPNRYFVSLWFGDQAKDEHIAEDALSFDVVERDLWGTWKCPPERASLMWWPTEFAFITRS